MQDGSPTGEGQTCSTAATTNSKRLLLNQEYIKRGQARKGTIYGLGNVQYKNIEPSESVPASLKRSLGMEMRVCDVETLAQEIKSDVLEFKTDFQEKMTQTQSTLNTILQLLQPQASNPSASTAQPTQSQAPQGQAPSQSQGDSQLQHVITNNLSELNRRCNAELGL
ncbi:unnamed protein product [Eruca vesicaria subsp. sativa]|uniref:Uncharacterized protein n=1 Tax=Eruca vesicaria subsp. sativa TaxID=29727 RepID=A0ABC8JAQ4_ERUVS|nr:unnamed protein product [Eruca vesicaria subsp. sativa]